MPSFRPAKRSAVAALQILVGIAFGGLAFDAYVYVETNHLNAALTDFERSTFDRQLALANSDPTPPEESASVRAVSPTLLLRDGGLSVDGETLFPLGGIPGHKTYLCRECGPMVHFQADRYGFNNPPESWDGRPDIAFVGDSFTQGACVWPEESIPGLVRAKGYKVVNLGMVGNGPLIELASLREYLSPRRPPVVVWMFFNNDIQDLVTESANPILVRYRDDPDFRQGLEERADGIGSALTAWYMNRLEAAQAANGRRRQIMMAPPPAAEARTIDFLLLRHARHRLGLVAHGKRFTGRGIDMFPSVLAKAHAAVAAWGGELVFVYLPQPGTSMGIGDYVSMRDWAVGVARHEGLRVVDGTEAFAGHDLTDLFCGHYTPLGNRLVAELLSGILDQRRPAAMSPNP